MPKPTESEFESFLRDQLRAPVSFKRMFGGAGLFQEGIMIGLIADDTLYWKADAVSQSDFEAVGMTPFLYEKGGKPVALSYWRCPPDALEDPDELETWRARAFEAALRAAAKKKPKRPRSSGRA
ncbi:MAG: TfoX/Sxy family protein [Alphaproteobacteria bacterium]|nr:TfoX/Sxy family protein [Alphaproteobacteria bacterium]